jgi:uncharacterized protein (TIGR02246 family)
MKNTLLAVLAVIAFINPLKAQDIKKDMEAFIKKFEAAYNKKDDASLKNLYTEKAVWTEADGTSRSGNEAIRASLAENFANGDVVIEIKQTKTEKQADGSVIGVGTYHVTGKAKSGDAIDSSGGYTNTLVKEKGDWKISKTVLASL